MSPLPPKTTPPVTPPVTPPASEAPVEAGNAYVPVSLSNSIGSIHSGKTPVSIINSRFV